MVNRIIIVGAVIAAMLLWLGPFYGHQLGRNGLRPRGPLPLSIVLSVKRMRLESCLARAFWLALTRK